MKISYENIRNKVGNATEELVSKKLRELGFWNYITPKKQNGQPIDIIAIKGNIPFLMDAKHVRENEVSFPFSRVEPNQITSMMYAKEFANIKNLGFAIFFERTGVIYWYPFEKFLESRKNGLKSVNMNELEEIEKVINDENNNKRQNIYLQSN